MYLAEKRITKKQARSDWILTMCSLQFDPCPRAGEPMVSRRTFWSILLCHDTWLTKCRYTRLLPLIMSLLETPNTLALAGSCCGNNRRGGAGATECPEDVLLILMPQSTGRGNAAMTRFHGFHACGIGPQYDALWQLDDAGFCRGRSARSLIESKDRKGRKYKSKKKRKIQRC